MTKEEYLVENFVSAYNTNIEIATLLEIEGCGEVAKPYRYTAATIRFVMESVYGVNALHYKTLKKTCVAGNYTVEHMEEP